MIYRIQGNSGGSASNASDKNNFRIGVVTARFNIEVTKNLEIGALQFLEKEQVSKIFAVRVAGAVEIPLAAKILLEQGCDGVVALGAVIRGDTAHFDYVCNSVERGCTELQLSHGKPVGFGVLTTENEEQALDRAGGRLGNKGEEAAAVVLEMLHLIKEIRNIPI